MIRPTDFAICVSEYFTKHLAGVRNLSSNTIKSYRDMFCLLLFFMNKEINIRTEKISLASIDDKVICTFLDWLESDRGNSVSTRNLRLAAIHAFYRYVQMQHPEMLLQCQRIIAIPLKETEKRTVEYLSEDILKELLSLPNQSKNMASVIQQYCACSMIPVPEFRRSSIYPWQIRALKRYPQYGYWERAERFVSFH